MESWTRLQTRKGLKMGTVPVIRLDHLTDELERRAYAGL
jgi:hypothetical protein